MPRPDAPSALNFITPIPFDIEVPVDGAHPWVSADAPPGDDAPDSEHLASYFGDGGCPTGLGYDVEFLLSAVQVELFLGADNLVRRRTSQVQVGGREPAAEIDFSRDNQDVSLGAPDSAQVAQR